jgi:hypothetical protein
MTPEAKFSWLMAAMAVVLFGLFVLLLDRIVPSESSAILATHHRSRQPGRLVEDVGGRGVRRRTCLGRVSGE